MKEDGYAVPPEVLTSTTDICRDFLRNVCYRDKRCKFRHLTSEELAASVNTKADLASKDMLYEFCHDFQNQGCDRPSCRFIHCSEEIEQLYQEQGILPIRLKYEFELGVQELFAAPSVDTTNTSQDKSRPVCRDFIQRQCRRGKKCRFVHLDSQLDKEDTNTQLSHMRPRQDMRSRNENEALSEHVMHADKRMRLIRDCHDESGACLHPDALQHMKDENIMLRKEVAELRKQVSGLSATNEVLLEQNAQFRLQKRLTNQGESFSRKSFESQSTMAVSVPIAMSLSLPQQTQQQLTNTPGLAGAALINSDPLPAVAPGSQAVSVMTRAAVPGQTHIQFPQNAARIVTNISQSNTRLVDGLQSLTSHQVAVNSSQGIQANVPIMQQASITGTNFSINRKLPLTQDLVWSIPDMTKSSISHSLLQNSPLVEAGIQHQNTITLSQTAGSPNVATPNTLVGQSGHALSVKAETKSLAPLNHNMAAQMTHAALVNSSQDPSSARAAGDLSASIAAVAAQVIAAHAQPSADMGTAQISVPTVPCVTLAPAIVPMTITTSLPVARMVSSLPLDNHSNSLIATQIEAVGGARTTSRSTCLASDNTISFNTVNGHRVVSSKQQLTAPLNFTITQVPSVPQPQSGLHT